MEKSTFIKKFRVEDTLLDRRYKLSREDRNEIKIKYLFGCYDISGLSKEYGVAYGTIQNIVNPNHRIKMRINKRKWYYSQDRYRIRQLSKKWKESCNRYKGDIYDALMKNL